MAKEARNQGEGDRQAAEHYNRKTREFVESGRVRPAAERAKEGNKEAMAQAEEQGQERAEGYDPNVERDYSKGTR